MNALSMLRRAGKLCLGKIGGGLGAFKPEPLSALRHALKRMQYAVGFEDMKRLGERLA
jgi:hypothetical protein